MTITNEDNIKSWSKFSSEMIEKFGDEGDFSRQYLLNPAIFDLLGDFKGKKILDAGCGQGYLSRLLAQKGGLVTGVEPADNLIEYAISREDKEELGINYIKGDLSNWDSSHNTYDIVVANMVFMDIPDFKSAINNCINSLKPGGSFIFSILHPCFEESVNWQEHPFVTTKEYFKEYEVEQFAGYFIHRTLSTYLNFLIEDGCNFKKIIEPKLSEEDAKKFQKQSRDAHIPSFLVVYAVKS